MIIIVSLWSRKKLSLWQRKVGTSLGLKMCACSVTCFLLVGGKNFHSLQNRNLAFLFRDTLWAKFQLWAVGCTCENRLPPGPAEARSVCGCHHLRSVGGTGGGGGGRAAGRPGGGTPLPGWGWAWLHWHLEMSLKHSWGSDYKSC